MNLYIADNGRKRKILSLLFLMITIMFCLYHNDEIKANDFSDVDEWMEKCSLPQDDEQSAQACKSFKQYYEGLQKDTENKISDLVKQSDEVKNNIDALSKMVNEQSEMIKDINNKIEENNKNLSAMKAQGVKLELDINMKTKDIEKRNQQIMERMLNDQASITTNENIEILMGSTDLLDLIRRTEGIQKITQYDKEEIKKFEKEKAKLDLLKSELDRLKQVEIDKKAENEKAKKDAEKLQKEREKLLNVYRGQESELNEKMRSAKADMSQIQNNMIHINTSVAGKLDYNKSENNTSMMSPISPVAYSTGTWHYPESFGGGAHLGADFAVGVGTPIVAPADGIILYAANPFGTYDGYLYHWIGWPLGGGNTLMFLTQVNGTTYAVSFAHMAHENFYVHAGDQVKKGQQLGCTGASGNVTGPHAHVELFNLGSMSMEEAITYFNQGADFAWGCGWSNTTGLSNICSVSGRTPCRERPEDFWN